MFSAIPPATSSSRRPLLQACQAARLACVAAAQGQPADPLAPVSPEVARLLREVADLLALTCRALRNGSPLQGVLLHAVARACDQVERQCPGPQGDPCLGSCAERCRAVAQTCRQLLHTQRAAYPKWERGLA
jgi:hypothetical protein